MKKANSVAADDALIWFCAIYCLRHFADNSSLACYFEDFLRFFFYGSCFKQTEVSWRLSGLSPGPGCSKLTTSLVNEPLKFQMLISQIGLLFFFVEKM